MDSQEAVKPPVSKRTAVLSAVGVAIVLIGVIWLSTRPAQNEPDKPGSSAVLEDKRPSPVTESLDSLIPRKNVEVKPEEVPPPPKKDPEKAYASTDTSKDWSVIAATLNSYDSAERRAEGLKTQWKECVCSVFPRGESAKYFVVVGTGLDRNAADRLRDRATQTGFPPDTYVTKLIRRSEDEER